MGFAGCRDRKKPTSNNTILYALDSLGYRDRILNEHEFDEAHIEVMLAHTTRNKVAAAYNHAKYLMQRTEMMQWGRIIWMPNLLRAELTQMVADGRLDAAIVTLPFTNMDLIRAQFAGRRCWFFLRRYDPFGLGESVPQSALSKHLSILFTRVHQPELYDSLMKKLLLHDIHAKPFEFYSSQAEMEYMVKSGKGWSLVQESTELDPDLCAKACRTARTPAASGQT